MSCLRATSDTVSLIIEVFNHLNYGGQKCTSGADVLLTNGQTRKDLTIMVREKQKRKRTVSLITTRLISNKRKRK